MCIYMTMMTMMTIMTILLGNRSEQHGAGLFSLSPALDIAANATLGEGDMNEIYFHISWKRARFFYIIDYSAQIDCYDHRNRGH